MPNAVSQAEDRSWLIITGCARRANPYKRRASPQNSKIFEVQTETRLYMHARSRTLMHTH